MHLLLPSMFITRNIFYIHSRFLFCLKICILKSLSMKILETFLCDFKIKFHFSSSYYQNAKSIWTFEKIMQNKVRKLYLFIFAKQERISNQKNQKNFKKYKVAHPTFSEIVQIREPNCCYSHLNSSPISKTNESQACFCITYLRFPFSGTFLK